MPPLLMTYRDATALQRSDIPQRSVIMYKSGAVLDSGRQAIETVARVLLRVTTGEFFPMFDVPFQYGQGWSAAADEGPDPVVVLSHETNQKTLRRREQRRTHGAARRPRVPCRRRAATVVAEPEVLRPEQRFVRGRGGRLPAVPLGRDPRVAGLRQHELLEERPHRVVCRFPELRMRLGADVGGTADRRRPRPLPGVRRQLRAPAEGGRPVPAPAQQPVVRRRPVAGLRTTSSRRTTAC